MLDKFVKKEQRHTRIRAKIEGTTERPRLAVFASNKHIVAQIIDDSRGVTLAYATDKEMKTGTKTEHAKKVGELVAELALKNKVKNVVFDRGGKLYHGRVKALAEAAREKGLNF